MQPITMSPHATITPTKFLVSIAWNTMAELPSYLQLAATTSRSSASFAVVVSTETSKLLLSACQHQTARVHHQLLALSNSSWLYGCCACHHCKGYDLASFVCEEGRAITD